MPFLKETQSPQSGRIFNLRSGENLIGRDPKTCMVILEHYAVSRKHALIDVLPDGTFIQDLNSRNGVLVNNSRVEAGHWGRTRLKPQDRIKIGIFDLIFEEDPYESEFVSIQPETQNGESIYSTVDVIRDSSEELLTPGDEWTAKLQAVLKIIDHLSAARLDSIDIIMPRVIDTLSKSFPITQNAYIQLIEPASGDFRTVASLRRDNLPGGIRISRSLREYVVNQRQAVLAGNLTQDQRFKASASLEQLQVSSMMSVPLVDSSRHVMGLIQLEVVHGSQAYTHDDLEVLAGVARHISTVIENVRLHEKAMRTQRADYERRFRQLIEGSIHGVLIHRHFQPLYVNERWAAMHGYTVAEIEKLPSVLNLVASEFKDQTYDYALAHLQSRPAPQRYERQGVRRDGSRFWLEEFSMLVEWNNRAAIQSVIIDLSDRKKAEQILQQSKEELEQQVQLRTQELAQSEALYRSLVNNLQAAVSRKNTQGVYTFVNQPFCDLFQKKASELMGTADAQLFPASIADKLQQDDRTVLESHQSVDSIDTLAFPSNQTLVMQTRRSPLYDDTGSVSGIQIIQWDLTALKRTEEACQRYALELERSNRDLEEFAYSVAHDLQSPLRTVTAHCQRVLEKSDALRDSDTAEDIKRAVGGLRRMKHLVDDLLTYALVNSGVMQPEPVPVTEILAEVQENLQTAIIDAGAQITVTPLPAIVCDRTQLSEVFQNLIANAIQYRSQATPAIQISAQPVQQGWQFSVADNGIGIEPRHHERIFQIFQRLHSDDVIPGSGIGLALCKKIVERHGGRIWVKSQLGAGSTFHFVIPTLPPESPDTDSGAKSQ